MEDVRHARFQHHRREGADIAPIHVVRVGATARLSMQPGISGADDPMGGGLHRPSVRGRIIVRQEAADRRLGGNRAYRTRADAVRDRHCNALIVRAAPPGTTAPWKSLLEGFSPLSEHCPSEIVRCGLAAGPGAAGPAACSGSSIHAVITRREQPSFRRRASCGWHRSAGGWSRGSSRRRRRRRRDCQRPSGSRSR